MAKSKHITLIEYGFLQYKEESSTNFIDQKVFEEIECFVLNNLENCQYLKIASRRGFGKVLIAQNYVGIIQTKNGTTIEILPKIANESVDNAKNVLLKMLKTLRESPFKNINSAHLKSCQLPLLEIFIGMFLDELSWLIKKGIKSDYLNKQENTQFLKGKLMIAQQVKYNTVHKERFFVDYQEFSANRVENRLIKTTLQYLYKKSKSLNNLRRIREYLFVFDGIDSSHSIKTDFNKVNITRQMKEYEKVLLWSKTFLLGNSFSPYKGKDVAFALLFNMNALFESYVGCHLRKQGYKVKFPDRKHHLAYLDGNAKFQLKPDFVIESDNQTIIADAKWKILSEEKNKNISQADLYQLFAYGTKYQECENLILIYPKCEDFNVSEYKFYRNTPKLNLKVLFFDVENPNSFEMS